MADRNREACAALAALARRADGLDVAVAQAFAVWFVLDDMRRLRGGRRALIEASHTEIAVRIGSSVTTVQRALVALRRVGLVEWTPRRGERGGRAINWYMLSPTGSSPP